MPRLTGMIVLTVLAAIAAGCNKSGDKTPAATVSGGGATPAASNSDDPKVIVTAYLECLRTGDDEKALPLLTTAARAAGGNVYYTPPASDTAKFQVGEVRFVGDSNPPTGAQVACTWTELDKTGKPADSRLLCVCRKEAEGWRIAGVAAAIFENEEPLVLNFEDPADIAKKKQWLLEETARREKLEVEATGADAPPTQAKTEAKDAFQR